MKDTKNIDESQVDLIKELNKRDNVRNFYKRMYDRQRLSNQFLEIYHNKYGKNKPDRGEKKG